VGCFHIQPDGKIIDTKIKEQSGSPDLDTAAENAIDAVKKLRNDNPEVVPDELLGQISRWICFRFDPNKT
jgi:TonB family protein